MLNHTLVTHSLSDNGKNLREMTLIQMPLSNTPLSYVVGSEYRKDTSRSLYHHIFYAESCSVEYTKFVFRQSPWKWLSAAWNPKQMWFITPFNMPKKKIKVSSALRISQLSLYTGNRVFWDEPMGMRKTWGHVVTVPLAHVSRSVCWLPDTQQH